MGPPGRPRAVGDPVDTDAGPVVYRSLTALARAAGMNCATLRGLHTDGFLPLPHPGLAATGHRTVRAPDAARALAVAEDSRESGLRGASA